MKLARLLVIFVLFLGILPASAQGSLPDLALEYVSLSGDTAVVYRNDGASISGQQYSITFQWVDASGAALAPKQTLTRNTLATRGREALGWNNTNVEGTVMVSEQRCYTTGGFFRRRRECNYIQVPRTVTQPLAAYRTARPNPNALLAVMLDDGNRIQESNEGNNSARVGNTPFVGPPPAPLAELVIPRATFDGQNLFVVIQNQSAANIANQPFYVSLQWQDQNSQAVGDKRFIGFKNMASGKVELIDSRTNITVLEKTGPGINEVNVAGLLSAYLAGRPVNAMRLQIIVDDGNQILENTEANNVATINLPPLRLPDLALTKRVQIFNPQQLVFSYGNIGQAPLLGSPIFSLWFEWVDASGTRVGNHLYWQDRDARSLPPGASAVFISSSAQVLSSSGTVALDKVLQSPPPEAVSLKITIDGQNAFTELNETNNSVLLAKPVMPLPDLALTKQVQIFNPQQLVFSYVNASTVPLTQFPTLSLWFEWVDSKGARVGELYWNDRAAASVPLGTASIFNAYGVYVSSARAFASLDSILKNPPATATHLKITIDGPNRFRETDESNNSALLPKPVVPMPDFSLREASRTPNVIRTVLQNEGTVPSRAPEWEFRWLGADDKVLATSSRTVYSIAWPIPKQVRPFEIPYAQGREDAVNRFLKNPPAGTLALEIILDPQNQIAETREDNNTFRIKLDYPDLAFGAIAVSDGILKIEVKNQGITPAAPTDIWLQWWSASAPLNGSEAFQIASAVMPGTAYSATLSLKGTSPAEKLIGAPPEGATRLRLFLDGSRKVTELNEENNSTMVERSLFPKPEPTPTLTLSLSVQIIRAQAVTPLRSLIEKLVSILWQGYELSAQTDEALVGDQVRANMVIKNVGNAPATEVTIYLPCPEGTTWISTAANGVSQSRNSAEGLAMADLTEGSAHGLSAICKIEASAGEKGSVRFVGSAQIKEVTNKFNSNNVEITVKPRILSAKPDLEVGGTGLLPKEDVVKAANQPFEADFTAIVQNNGAVSAPASRARLRVDAGADGTWDTIGPAFANVGALDPDKTALVKFTVGWVAPLGRYGFEICANADKVFPESDEANNCTTDHFTLQAGEEPIFEEEVVE